MAVRISTRKGACLTPRSRVPRSSFSSFWMYSASLLDSRICSVWAMFQRIIFSSSFWMASPGSSLFWFSFCASSRASGSVACRLTKKVSEP